jgi:acyl carrier protein
MDIRTTILRHLARTMEDQSPIPFPEEVRDETRLDEFWLDSVAFAAWVSGIEGELGYIPSAFVDGGSFPETFGDFVQLYEAHVADGTERA